MKNKLALFQKHNCFILIIILSFFFFYLKSIGYSAIPDNNILDEKDYALSGYSFRKTLIPVGWSNMNIYSDISKTKDRGGQNVINFANNGINLSINGVDPNISNKDYFKYPLAWTTEIDVGKGKEHISLVQPFLDHPFLGGLTYSLKTNNATSFGQISSTDYRYVAILISVISGILIYLVATSFFNKWVGLISFLIYSTAPIFVLTSRYALLENILIPLFLIAALLNNLYLKRNRSSYLILIGIICGLSFLVKESGVFILLYSLLINIKNKTNKKEYLKLFIPFILIIGTYFSYSVYLSPEITFKLLFAQTQRSFYGPLSLVGTIFQPGFNNFPIDGYWVFGFISLIIILIKSDNKFDFIKYGFMSYASIYLLQGSLNYPWYSLPFVPLIVISSGILIHETILNGNIYQKLLIILIPISSSLFWGYLIQHSSSATNIYRAFALYVLLLLLIKNKKISTLLFMFALIACIGLNYRSVQYLVANWRTIPSQYQIKTYE